MAKVAFGGGVSNIQGSIAGNTFTRTRGGPAARNKAKPNNPATKAQLAQRARLSRLSGKWRALTEDERNAWVAEAKETKRKGVCGNNIEMTGHQLFVKVNSLREENGDTTAAATVPLYPEFLSDVFNESADPTLDISDSYILIPLGANAVADLDIVVYASSARSPGKLAHKGQLHKVFIGKLNEDNITAGSVNIFAEWVAKYGTFSGTEGKAITFSCREYQSGWYNNPILMKAVIVA